MSLRREKSEASSSSKSESELERVNRCRSRSFSLKLSLLCFRLAEEVRVCKGMFAGLRLLLPPMLKGMVGEVRVVDRATLPST